MSANGKPGRKEHKPAHPVRKKFSELMAVETERRIVKHPISHCGTCAKPVRRAGCL